jgi:hypothetical protein
MIGGLRRVEPQITQSVDQRGKPEPHEAAHTASRASSQQQERC